MDKPADAFQQTTTVTMLGVRISDTIVIKSPVSYIKKYLIKEIGEIVEAHQELSWVLMMAGIELLGRCVKENVSDDSNNEMYFREGLKLFKPEYQKYNTNKKNHYDLYKKMRCGFSHLTFPKEDIVISERGNGGMNLSFYNGKLILVAEDFYDDFKEACLKVIEMFKARTIRPDFHYYGVKGPRK